MIEKRATYLGAGLKWLIIGMLATIVALFIVGSEYSDLLGNVYLPLIGLIILVAVWRSWRVGRLIQLRSVGFSKLADEYGYGLSDDKPALTKIFRLVDQRDARFLNTIKGKDWCYGDFTYNIYHRTKYGDYRGVEVYYSILELDLPRRLPNMFFDAPGAHGLQFLPYLDESQRTSLEGDFDQYFTTYFPRHYHIDARSIISPEVMTAMIDSGVSDIEIKDDKLYLYSALMPVDDVSAFIKEGQNIRKKLSDHVVFYKDEKLADKADRQSVSVFGKSLRKKPRFPWLMLLVSVAIIVPVSVVALSKGGYTDYLLFAAISFACFVGIFFEAKAKWWNLKKSNASLDRRYHARTASQKTKSEKR